MSKPQWKLIIGLGNPGKEYEKTYHNAGFLIINEFLKILDKKTTGRFLKNFWYTKTDQKIWVKPTCFMNNSGQSVLQAADYFKISPEKILVIHDDADILFNQHKLSFGRGSAGHRGVQSIIDCLKTNKFWRLRIGVRKKHKIKSEDFVLRQINKEDEAILLKKTLEIRDIYF